MKSTNGFVNRARNVLIYVSYLHTRRRRARERERRREREEEEEEEKAFVRSFVRSSLFARFTISVRHFFIQKTGKNVHFLPNNLYIKGITAATHHLRAITKINDAQQRGRAR
jgi:hypothetical protein